MGIACDSFIDTYALCVEPLWGKRETRGYMLRGRIYTGAMKAYASAGTHSFHPAQNPNAGLPVGQHCAKNQIPVELAQYFILQSPNSSQLDAVDPIRKSAPICVALGRGPAKYEQRAIR